MSGVCQTALWLKITLAQRYSRASLSLSGAERAAATQPARSPDVNILDEGLLHHLQVAVDKQRPGRNTNTYEARDELEKAAIAYPCACIRAFSQTNAENLLNGWRCMVACSVCGER